MNIEQQKEEIRVRNYINVVEHIEGILDDPAERVTIASMVLTMLIQKVAAETGQNKYEVMRLALRGIRKSMDTVLWRNKLNS